MPLLIELSWNIAAQQHRIRVDINDFPLRIGRAVDNDVVLDDLSVSRYHAQICYQDRQLKLLDAGSKYGTRIQDLRLTPHQFAVLADRCDLTFGELKVTFNAVQRTRFDKPYWSLKNLFVDHLPIQMTSRQKIHPVIDTFNTAQPSNQLKMQNSEHDNSVLSPQMQQWCRQNRLLQQLTLLLQQQDVKQFLSHVIPIVEDVFTHSEITVVDMDAGHPVVVLGSDVLLDQFKRLLAAVPTVYSQVQHSVKQGEVVSLLPGDSRAGETIWCLPIGDCQPNTMDVRTIPMPQNPVMPSLDTSIPSVQNAMSSLLSLTVSEHVGGSTLLLLKTCPEHGYELNDFLPVLQRHLSVLLKQIKQIQRTMRDPLTGVSSRRYIEEKLQSAMLASKRWQHPLAVMFIDIDNFKQINDHYGHAVGDQVLQQVGKRLIDIVANVECVARLGGEEFVVLCNMTTTAACDLMAECDALAQRLLKAFYTVGPSLNYPQLTVTASIGLANFSPQTHHQPYQLIESADMAMYQAKRAGKNRVCWYKAAPNSVMDTQLTQTSSAEIDSKMTISAISMCGHD